MEWLYELRQFTWDWLPLLYCALRCMVAARCRLTAQARPLTESTGVRSKSMGRGRRGSSNARMRGSALTLGQGQPLPQAPQSPHHEGANDNGEKA